MSTYATVVEAEAYFLKRLDHVIWDDASLDDKTRSMEQASRLISTLNYSGDKADEDQELEFPRDDDTSVPDIIKYAQFEIMYALLDGIDPEMEHQTMMQTQAIFGPTQARYDRRMVQEWITHSIPSALAWAYLKPYLRDPTEITLSRIN